MQIRAWVPCIPMMSDALRDFIRWKSENGGLRRFTIIDVLESLEEGTPLHFEAQCLKKRQGSDLTFELR